MGGGGGSNELRLQMKVAAAVLLVKELQQMIGGRVGA